MLEDDNLKSMNASLLLTKIVVFKFSFKLDSFYVVRATEAAGYLQSVVLSLRDGGR